MYIRTKDWIYEVLSEYDTPENTTLISNPVTAFDVKVTPRTYSGASIRIIYSNEIISQSENLEELCDEFVGLIKDRNSDFIITKVIAHSLKELKDSLKTEFNGKTYYGKFDIIYGAIWTSKGLIYVAKMNDKGKLVLI